MDLFEYQARDLFESHKVPVLGGAVAYTPEEAEKAAANMGGKVVVKAQVKIGGRGKAGGVKLAENASDAKEKAKTAHAGVGAPLFKSLVIEAVEQDAHQEKHRRQQHPCQQGIDAHAREHVSEIGTHDQQRRVARMGKGKGYRTFTVGGYEVLVGKGSRDNDELTFDVAAGHDGREQVGAALDAVADDRVVGGDEVVDPSRDRGDEFVGVAVLVGLLPHARSGKKISEA